MRDSNKMKNNKICCMCGNMFKGYGNNAEPIRKGICCNYCNKNVIMIRLTQINDKNQQKSTKININMSNLNKNQKVK